jgi:hypothetical protein
MMNTFGGAGMLVSLLLWAVFLAFLGWVLIGMLRREERVVVVRIATADDLLRERLAHDDTVE